jgi:hypothetical protein
MEMHTSPFNYQGANIGNSFIRNLRKKNPSVKNRNGYPQTKLLD